MILLELQRFSEEVKKMTIQAEYLIDEKGEKKSIVLSIKDYLRLMEYLDDLEDAVDLKKAKDHPKGFIEFENLARQLKRQGRIH
ncbi:MAG: hypothetical protein AB1765_09410 [Candidatus Hydrogenedentota bacterium]